MKKQKERNSIRQILNNPILAFAAGLFAILLTFTIIMGVDYFKRDIRDHRTNQVIRTEYF